MDFKGYIEKINSIQKALLSFIDEENEPNRLYQALIQVIDQLKILEDYDDLKSILYLISKISNDHHRLPAFYEKIDKLLLNFKDEMQRYYSNSDIFNIFYSNKRIILFLIQSSIIKIDEYILTQIQDQKYSEFFSPEIQRFVKTDDEEDKPKDSLEEFKHKRLIGENDSYLCQLIRQDSIEEFIFFTSKSNSPLEGQIPRSIFETNLFLIDKNPTLIEYAAFFGSINIFKYLKINGVSYTYSLWFYAIHGNNAEILSILEENTSNLEPCFYDKCFEEAVKCYHQELANYFEDNFSNLSKDDKNNFGIKHYNYEYIEKGDFFESVCLNNASIARKLIECENIDINATRILNFFFFNKIKYSKF